MKLALLTIWRALLGMLWLNVFTFFIPTFLIVASFFPADREAFDVYIIGWMLFLIGVVTNGGWFLYGLAVCYRDTVCEMREKEANV